MVPAVIETVQSKPEVGSGLSKLEPTEPELSIGS